MSEFENKLNIICLESDAFYALIDEIMERMKDEDDKGQDRWISDEEAMQLLRIRSRSTLQKLRDERAIRFSQPAKKLILYDRESILHYIDKHAKDIHSDGK